MTLPPADRGVATPVPWTLAFGNMKAALADLESACEGILEQIHESARQSAAAIEAADRRIGEVSASADAAVEQVRRDAQLQIAELRVSIEQLRSDLLAERTLRQASEAAAAAVRQTPPPTADDAMESATEQTSPDPQSDTDPARNAEATTLGFDAAEYARQLLDHLESVYQADEAAGILPADLVERLVANLLYASDVFGRRAGSANRRDADAFQRQLAIALDTKGGTSFGRHLAVAAFEHTQRRKPGDQAQVA